MVISIYSIQFADDTTIYMGSRHLKYLRYCIEQDLRALHDWFNANKLTLNIGKMVGMLFSPNNNNHNLHVEINSTSIPIVHLTKFLGTWINSSLNWKTHVDKLALWINSRNGLLKRGE